jgi:PIN domain nuclease of toxin-antitoxin system
VGRDESGALGFVSSRSVGYARSCSLAHGRQETVARTNQSATVLGGEPVAVSAVSLIEIARLVAEERLLPSLDAFFNELQANPLLRVLPITYEIASEVASLGRAIGDPVDRAIVATARVHRLRLVTSDQRIIESKLVAVVD